MRHYTILGNPIAWSRAMPLYASRTMIDSQKEQKLITGIQLRKQHPTSPLEGPLQLHVTFYMPIPASKRKKVKEGDSHHTKPDLDNLEKYLADAANTILYKDDSQIAAKVSQKVYSNSPRTEFTLEEIK